MEINTTIIQTPLSIKAHKEEERNLSEGIYNNLHILCLFNKPTDDFVAVFTKVCSAIN